MGSEPRDRDGVRSAVWTRALCSGGLALGTAWLVWLGTRRPSMTLEDVISEGYPALEWAQFVLWGIVAAVASVACARQRAGAGVMLGAWLGVLAVLAGMRELDLHAVLNPPNIHLLGLEPGQAVRFRLDWWTDGSVPLGLKAAWAVVLGAIGAAAVVPFALARYPWGRRLLARDRFAWLIAGGLAALAAAYAGDDLMRPVFRSLGVSFSLIEELLEFLGQGLVLAGVALLALRRAGMPGELGG